MAAITITTRPTPRRRPTTSPRRSAVAAGRARVATTRATYWRRRLAAVALVIGLVLVMAQAGAALGGGSSTLTTPERRPALVSDTGPTTVVVQPGDSLWSIARRLAPDRDPRPVVDALTAARHGAVLVPGETVEWSG
jgi:nucleoid-associated protein YgaU